MKNIARNASDSLDIDMTVLPISFRICVTLNSVHLNQLYQVKSSIMPSQAQNCYIPSIISLLRTTRRASREDTIKAWQREPFFPRRSLPHRFWKTFVKTLVHRHPWLTVSFHHFEKLKNADYCSSATLTANLLISLQGKSIHRPKIFIRLSTEHV